MEVDNEVKIIMTREEASLFKCWVKDMIETEHEAATEIADDYNAHYLAEEIRNMLPEDGQMDKVGKCCICGERYGNYGHNKSSGASYLQYASNINTKTASFSKDQMLAMSNMPINSSRSLRYEQKYNTPPQDPRVIYIFLHYLKVLQLSITDVKVDI